MDESRLMKIFGNIYIYSFNCVDIFCCVDIYKRSIIKTIEIFGKMLDPKLTEE